MALTPYILAVFAFYPTLSITCVKLILSATTACNQSFFLLSIDTPNTSNPFDLYLLYNFTTLGLDARHGPHQLAQKSIKTTLPLKLDSLPNCHLHLTKIFQVPFATLLLQLKCLLIRATVQL